MDVGQDRPDFCADQTGHLEFLEKRIQRECVDVAFVRGSFLMANILVSTGRPRSEEEQPSHTVDSQPAARLPGGFRVYQ